MGRPPLKLNDETKPTMVRLTKELRLRIEAAAGENRMAAFIREAIEEKLERDASPTPSRKPKPPTPDTP